MITIELIADPELGGFTARVPDIPAYGEGETEEEAIADLKEAILGYIDAFGLGEQPTRVASQTCCFRIRVRPHLLPESELDCSGRISCESPDNPPC